MIRRILALVFGILLGAVAVGVIWCSAAPREFFQTVMSDEAYAVFTLAQNTGRTTRDLAKQTKAQTAYSYRADIEANLDKSAIMNSDTVAEAISDYINTLDCGGNIYFSKDSLKATTVISDKDAALLSGEMIFKGSKQYIKFDQLGGKWLGRENKNPVIDDGKIKKPDKVIDTDDMDMKISVVNEDRSMTVGKITVSGENISMITPIENLSEMMDESLISYFKNKGVKEAVINLFVDKRNHITGVSIGLADEKGENATCIMAAKSPTEEGVYAFEYYADNLSATADVKVEKAPFEAYEIPKNSEVIPIDSTTLKEQFRDYVFGELVNNHPQLKEAVNALISKLIEDAFSNVAGDLFSVFGGKGAA